MENKNIRLNSFMWVYNIIIIIDIKRYLYHVHVSNVE